MTAADAAIASLKTTLIESVVDTLAAGESVRLQVHVFDESYSGRDYPGQPYAGHITCKDYPHGDAAIAAIAQMGTIAGALGSTRLLAVWEEYDLRTSVLGPDEAYPGVPRGVALLDVTDDGHELSWHPFRIGAPLELTQGSGREIDLSWGQPSVHPNAALGPGVSELVRSWQAIVRVGNHQFGEVWAAWAQHLLSMAADAGYQIRPVRR